jgi:hypothetical protein
MLPGLGAFKNLTEGALRNLQDGVREFSTAALNEVREGVAQVSSARGRRRPGAALIAAAPAERAWLRAERPRGAGGRDPRSAQQLPGWRGW